MGMRYPEIKIHVAKNGVTVSWEEDSVLHVFYVELGVGVEAGYQTSAGENLKIYSGSRDDDALISVVRVKDLVPLLEKHAKVSRVVAKKLVLRYYREIRQNITNPEEVKAIVKRFRSEVLGILGIAN